MHKLTQVARGLGISNTQLRNWGKEFADHLSEHANPGKNQTRLYTDNDLAVLQTIAVLRNQETSYSDIDAALAAGERLELTTITQTGSAQDVAGDDNKSLALITELQTKAAKYEGELGAIKGERDHLRNQLDIAQAARRAAEIHAAELQTELRILRELTEDKSPQGEKSSFWARLFNRNP